MYLLRGGARSAAGRPPAGLLLTEPVRGLVGRAALLVAAPGLLVAPRGDGHGALIFRPPLPLRPLYSRSAQDPR
jgi:hypothetical protein